MSKPTSGRALRRARLRAAALALGLVAAAGTSLGEEGVITVASTTSTENSGLFAHLLPMFTAESGIRVRVVAVGTGQAIRLAANGDADVLFVHHPPSEKKFVADGLGLARHAVMHNDFVLVGPADDPAESTRLVKLPLNRSRTYRPRSFKAAAKCCINSWAMILLGS